MGSDIKLPRWAKVCTFHFASCKTAGVIYLLTCSCGCFYIGKTNLEASRHIRSMKTCNQELPLGRNVWDVHQGKFPNIRFLILDRVHPSGRGGDWDKVLPQRETRWMVFLRATSPPGLNNSVSYHPFLEGFTSGWWEGKGWSGRHASKQCRNRRLNYHLWPCLKFNGI